MIFYQELQKEIKSLELIQNRRQLSVMENKGRYIEIDGELLLNLASNDYLGLAEDKNLQEKFLNQIDSNHSLFSSTSSRLLTGNDFVFNQLEEYLCQLFDVPATMVFNSGYHMNIGIIPAVSTPETLILSDALNHASIIDGIRLAKKGRLIKYPHNDFLELMRLVEKHHKDFKTILIVSESIFSMDGDECDLNEFVKIKQFYDNVLLYIDEAHAFGLRGAQGLGCAQEYDKVKEIDFLVGTFGKAIHSVGGYLICNNAVLKEYLINSMRSFIFSTALPPINIAWTLWVLKNLSFWSDKRKYLHTISSYLIDSLKNKGYLIPSSSHIIPVIMGDNQKVIEFSNHLKKNGFYVLPIRFPTVPKGAERLRISLTANITKSELKQLIDLF